MSRRRRRSSESGEQQQSVLVTHGAQVLTVLVLIDLALVVASSQHDVLSLFRGHDTPVNVGATVGLLLSALIVLVALTTVRRVRGLQVDLHRDRQSLRADEQISDDWLWESDVEYRFTYSSAGVQLLLGYRPQEIIGRSALGLMAEPEREAAAAQLRESVAHGRGWDATEVTWLAADGRPVVLRGQSAPIQDEHGRLIGFRGRRRAISPAEMAERAAAVARQRLADVVQSGAVDIALQPIVDLASGQLAGAEALARFRDGRSPDVWFADAATAGLALELDRLTFGAALQTLPHLPESAYLSVNATPGLLLDGDLVSQLTCGDLPLERLVIEVTEHQLIDDYDELHRALSPLRERGVRLAIDDTGAGFASLTHVLKLRPDVIKLDRSLITNVSTDAARRSVVTALVLLALELGAGVTAEGIETPMELETLASLGADCGQGYLLGRPTTDPAVWRSWERSNWLAEPSRRDARTDDRLSTARS